MRGRYVKSLVGVCAVAGMAATGTLLASGMASASAQSGPGFPESFAAAYVGAWSPPGIMKQAMAASGIRYFNVSFVIDAGGCNAKLDGTTDVNDGAWVSAINAVRAAGGDVAVSFGGANGTDIAAGCGSVSSLKDQYRKVFDALNATRVDMDVEGAEISDTAAMGRRNQALADLQGEFTRAGKKLDVEYTLPAMPQGLTEDGLSILRDARKKNLVVDTVNPMTMDYGGGPTNMGQRAIDAANALHGQLAKIWPDHSGEQLWRMEGNTPMIGVNDDQQEVFTLSDASSLTDFARSKNMRELSYWAIDRDKSCGSGDRPPNDCSGVGQKPFEFAAVMNGITNVQQTKNQNPPPQTTNPTPAPHTQSLFQVPKTATIKGFAYKCVDVMNSDGTSGTAVQLHACNGSEAQKWTFSSSGPIVSLGKCMAPVQGTGGNGTRIELQTCDGGRAQMWSEKTNGTIVNTETGRCLDDTDRKSADGNPLQLWDCFGYSNQRWHINAV